MNPHLRLGLIIAGMALFLGFMMFQMTTQLLLPTLEWRRERAADYAAYQQVQRCKTRYDVERVLSKWKSSFVPGIAPDKKHKWFPDQPRLTFNRAWDYCRHEPNSVAPDLTPLHILIVCDGEDVVGVAATDGNYSPAPLQ